MQNCPCGLKGASNRIVNGWEANENEWPWQVALVRRGQRSPFCGGSIINERYIATAAHCTSGRSASSIEVVIEEHDHSTTSEGGRAVRVSRVIVHGGYNSRTLNNDISLLRLSSPLNFNQRVRPVCLPKLGSTRTFVGAKVVATGWGLQHGQANRPPNRLREVVLQALANRKCGNYPSSAITASMICATGPDLNWSKDSCYGDSGGPLTFKQPNGKFTLVGIVSWGSGCAGRGLPGVYVRVTRFLPWIKANTGDATKCRL